MAKTSPTSRTLAELRKLGAVCAIVERWNPHVKIRQDMMGFIDIIALLGPNIIAVQATSNNGGNHAARRAKIIAEPRALAWLKANGLIELWSWAKQGKRGEVKRWVCRKESIVLSDLSPALSA